MVEVWEDVFNSMFSSCQSCWKAAVAFHMQMYGKAEWMDKAKSRHCNKEELMSDLERFRFFLFLFLAVQKSCTFSTKVDSLIIDTVSISRLIIVTITTILISLLSYYTNSYCSQRENMLRWNSSSSGSFCLGIFMNYLGKMSDIKLSLVKGNLIVHSSGLVLCYTLSYKTWMQIKNKTIISIAYHVPFNYSWLSVHTEILLLVSSLPHNVIKVTGFDLLFIYLFLFLFFFLICKYSEPLKMQFVLPSNASQESLLENVNV